jgi:hypothetical protein
MDLNQFSYRQKNLGLLVGSIVFLLIIYFASIQKTIDMWRSNSELEEQVRLIDNAPSRIRKLKGQLDVFDSKMRNFSSDTSSKEEFLLEKISLSCYKNNLTLVSLPSPSYVVENELNVETRFVKARGSFINLLFLVHEIENQFKVGRVSSVKFALEEDKKNNAHYLFAYVYIQNIRQSGNGKDAAENQPLSGNNVKNN